MGFIGGLNASQNRLHGSPQGGYPSIVNRYLIAREGKTAQVNAKSRGPVEIVSLNEQ